MPPRALIRLLYYKNLPSIGPESKRCIFIRPLIGRRHQLHSERFAELPDMRSLSVYYEKVVPAKKPLFRLFFAIEMLLDKQ